MNDSFMVLTEQYFLKCLYITPDLINQVKENCCISRIGKSIFDTMQYLHNNKQTINKANIIRQESNGANILNNNSEGILDSLININVDKDSFDIYFEDLKKASVLDSLRLNEVKDLVKTLESKGVKSFEDIETSLSEAISKVKTITATDNIVSVEYNISEWLDSYKEVIKKRALGTENYPTGCFHMDNVNVLGVAPGYMTTIFGNSGSGKSSFKTYLCNRQLNLNIPCVNNTLEMTNETELDRLIAHRNDITIEDLLNKKKDSDLSDYVKQVVDNELKRLLTNSRFLIVDNPSQSIADLELSIPKWQERLNSKYFVLHLDLATMLADFKGGGDKQSTVYENTVNELHRIAREYGIHLVLYVQALRDKDNITINSMEDLEKFRPKLNNIKNSSAFEERSRVVLGLFRKRYYATRYLKDDPELDLMEDVMELQFLKQSMGNLPILKYFFKGETVGIYPYQEPNFDEEEE